MFQVGHNKGNRVCPLYCGPVNVAMTEEEEEEYGKQLNVDDQNLVNVDGTKLKLSVKLIRVILLVVSSLCILCNSVYIWIL